MGSGAGRSLVAAYGLGIGGVWIASGIRALSIDDSAMQRAGSFRRARAAGEIDARALARLEGSLIAEAERAREGRHAGAVGSLGLAAGGAIAVVLSLVGHDLTTEARVAGSVVGGTYVLLGLWAGISALSGESDLERVVREYLDGEAENTPKPALHTTAWLAPHACGLALRASL